LLVRTAPNSRVPVDAIKQAVWSVVPEQPLFGIRPLADAVEQAMSQPRVVARLLAAFAFLALLISTLGVYTVVSYLTARRTREVAIRRAIGADSLDVVRLLALPTLAWSSAGLVVGVIAAGPTADVLRSVVLGIARFEASTVAGIAAVYLCVVAIAVAVPAIRALKVEPARILRAE
jgi:putative ABC transport system permease protein